MVIQRLIILLLISLLASQSIQAAMNVHVVDVENKSGAVAESDEHVHTLVKNEQYGPLVAVEDGQSSSGESHCGHCSYCHSHLSLMVSLGSALASFYDSSAIASPDKNTTKKRIELILRPPITSA